MLISVIPPEGVVPMWPKVRPYLSKAVEHTGGRYETDDILVALFNNEQHLWVAFNDEGVQGVAVTMFLSYPRKSVLSILFCAGVDAKEWRGEMLSTLRKWAKDHGCDAIEACGRKGWTRYMEQYGFKHLWVTYEGSVDEKEA